MGAKLYADTATKTLIVTAVPDGNGLIELSVQEEVWSDLIIDWEGDVNLRKHTFPVVAIGGQTISAGKLGTTYVLLDPWQIAPYEADHDFDINGNLFTESALTKLVLPTVGAYTVTVNRNLSTLVEVVETGTSGLTPTESNALIDIAADIALMQPDMAAQLAIMTGIEVRDLASHITYKSNGKVLVRNETSMRQWEGLAYEDESMTILYSGNGMAGVTDLAEIAWTP